MASDSLDLGQLTPSQQEALQQYTQVTNQEMADAIPLLQRSQWNVQVRTKAMQLPVVPSLQLLNGADTCDPNRSP